MSDLVLEVRDLTKRFGALRACDGVSLDLMPGEIHALIGPNGAGKSTLIKLISGDLEPDAGSIKVLGRNAAALDTAARAHLGLGRSFQVSSVLPEATVLQNVLLAVLGARNHAFRFFRPALGRADDVAAARGHLARLELEDRAASPAADLSHGERRRLEIAMALALGPKLFLLDEPMAGIGADGSQAMTQLLCSLRSEAPILLVEHDMDAVFALADRITVLDYGLVIASGSVDEIRADPEVRRAYLGEGAA